MNVDSISLEKIYFRFETSWIDLKAYSFAFNSTEISVIPCIG